MMKKLLVLTAVVTLTVGTVGCKCCDWFRRGALFPTTATMAPDVMCDPCCPANPCDPCGSAAPCDPCAPGTYSTPPAIYSTPPAIYSTPPGTYGAPPATVRPGPGPVTTVPIP